MSSISSELAVSYQQFLAQLSRFDTIIQLAPGKILGKWKTGEWRAYSINELVPQLVNTDIGQSYLSAGGLTVLQGANVNVQYQGGSSSDLPIEINSVNNSIKVPFASSVGFVCAASRVAVGAAAVLLNTSLSRETFVYNAGATSIDIGPAAVTSGGGFGLTSTPLGPLHIAPLYAISSAPGGSVGVLFI